MTDERAGRREGDPKLKELESRVDSIARDLSEVVGHLGSYEEKLRLNIEPLVSALDVVSDRLNDVSTRVTNFDVRVNGSVGKLDVRLNQVEEWKRKVEREAAFRQGLLVVPVSAVKIVAKNPQPLIYVAGIILALVFGANAGAWLSAIASWFGG